MDMPRPWTTTVLTHLGQPCGLPTLPTAAWTTPAGLPTCPHPLLLISASAFSGPRSRANGAFRRRPSRHRAERPLCSEMGLPLSAVFGAGLPGPGAGFSRTTLPVSPEWAVIRRRACCAAGSRRRMPDDEECSPLCTRRRSVTSRYRTAVPRVPGGGNHVVPGVGHAVRKRGDAVKYNMTRTRSKHILAKRDNLC